MRRWIFACVAALALMTPAAYAEEMEDPGLELDYSDVYSPDELGLSATAEDAEPDDSQWPWWAGSKDEAGPLPAADTFAAAMMEAYLGCTVTNVVFNTATCPEGVMPKPVFGNSEPDAENETYGKAPEVVLDFKGDLRRIDGGKPPFATPAGARAQVNCTALRKVFVPQLAFLEGTAPALKYERECVVNGAVYRAGVFLIFSADHGTEV